jgi:hypothetical protein
MPGRNGATPTPPHHGDAQEALAALACLLIRVDEHERGGLTRRCAVLAAGSELGIDPATVVRRVREVAA